jgi:hypothetical protein
VLGRFTGEDPKGFAAGDYNLFRYCGNDPEDHTDPMGLAYDDPPSTYSPADRGQAPGKTQLVWTLGSNIPQRVSADEARSSVVVTGQNRGVTEDFRSAPMGNKSDPNAPRRVIEDYAKGDDHYLWPATLAGKILKGEVAALESLHQRVEPGVPITPAQTSEGRYEYRDDGHIKDTVSAHLAHRGADVNKTLTYDQGYRIWFRTKGGTGMLYDIDKTKLAHIHTIIHGQVFNQLKIEQLP